MLEVHNICYYAAINYMSGTYVYILNLANNRDCLINRLQYTYLFKHVLSLTIPYFYFQIS